VDATSDSRGDDSSTMPARVSYIIVALTRMITSHCSFLYNGVEGLTQPRAPNLISCDAAISKSYFDDDEISKSFSAPNEDQLTELPSLNFSSKKMQLPLFEYNFRPAPSAQHVGCKPSSQASADSQCSSGYYSENSSLSDSRNDAFLPPSTNKLYPKGKCKLLRPYEKRHKGSSSNTKGSSSDTKGNNDSGTSSIENDKCSSALKPPNSHCISTNSHAQTYQNCFTNSPGANNYENASALNESDTPPLPPKPTKKKNPIYENQKTPTLFPMSPSPNSRYQRRQNDGSMHGCCICNPPNGKPGRCVTHALINIKVFSF